MFKIGDFSKLSRVPVKTLRYYDEIGLLKPVGVDRFTRYRYYSVEQLPVLYRILGLKELGFSLEQIARLLEGELSPEQLRRMLEKRCMEVEQGINQQRAQLQRLETRLKEIEQEGKMPDYEVILKRVESQWVASVRGVIPSYDESGPVFEQLFNELFAYVSSREVRSLGCSLAVYHDKPNGGEVIEIEAAVELSQPIQGNNRVRVYCMPASDTVASLMHHGPFQSIGKAYQAILGWVQANDYRVVGPARERYLSFSRDDPSKNITEIQIPVKKLRERSQMSEAKIINMDGFQVVGLPYLGKNEHGEIGKVWQELFPRLREIRYMDTSKNVSYGVCSPNPEGLIDYIAAFPVTRLSEIPEGMVGKEVPPQTYVVMESRGIEDIGPTYQRILHEWMPSSGYQPADGPDFELYTDEFNPEDPESVLYIYFPIQKV